ncbi:hypothetical protein RDV84_01450 [Lysobacter yananisis]|uniref:Transglycosylase SLT domain-containing protein n=1 Tax=Lysobacter yananisis TaxID=1003114 RepID=A0ABY9P950_9GAMM|nr:hypothetical protein [Lysobacter yananisis]WMT03546.1 hypothetical protein RDV84_01450 [Lysobacter yananisis]
MRTAPHNPRRTGLKAASLALLIGLGLAANVQAQTIGYNIRTGDVWVDTRLGEINDYGRRYREPFIEEMTGYYGAPRSLIDELLDRRRWAPGDVYYACALARSLGVPCLNVVREYDRNPGQGWGAVAQRMGIKPGSPAFHALKRGAVQTYDHWGYPIRVDQSVRVDWAEHGPGKGRGNANGNGKSHGGPKAHGNSGHGYDDGPGKGRGKDKGHGGGNGKGHGNGGGKGKDKGHGNGKGH